MAEGGHSFPGCELPTKTVEPCISQRMRVLVNRTHSCYMFHTINTQPHTKLAQRSASVPSLLRKVRISGGLQTAAAGRRWS